MEIVIVKFVVVNNLKTLLSLLLNQFYIELFLIELLG